MSDFAGLNNDGIPASAIYKQATDAANRGDFEIAKEICRNAIKQLERPGEECIASNAYHKVGMIAYQQGNFKDAESCYQEALEIDQRTGDDRGAARTCNNLSAVLNARGDYDAAEKWLWKSIDIKERLADERGLAASYHQLGVVAETRLEFGAAKKWYLRSLDIDEKLGNEINVVTTCLNLCGVAEKQGNNDDTEKWRQKALHVLDRKCDWSAGINLGRETEQQGKHKDAKILYLKALDIAKERGDDEGESMSYLWLGHLACEMGDFESAKDCYEKSIEIDEGIHATDRAARSRSSLKNICQTINQRRAT